MLAGPVGRPKAVCRQQRLASVVARVVGNAVSNDDTGEQRQLVQALFGLDQKRRRTRDVRRYNLETARLDKGEDGRLLDARERASADRQVSDHGDHRAAAHGVQEGGGRGELLRSENRRVHGAAHGRLRPATRLVDRVHVGFTENHDVDVVRRWTCAPEASARQRSHRGTPDSTPPMRANSSARITTGPVTMVRISRNGSTRGLSALARISLVRPAESLAQDASLQQPRDLAVGGRVRQTGLFGQIGEA